ncbi:MAG TPA: hypothetical protein DEG17_05730 [Cyanobacteria bacterium UBA11149]|nr:hypothetical protein [Cyanobacteria bacterium UBA11367]HBE60204.1 hypothetical protein [Cyanobacteria bacterium UBA11366]HBK66435.1 hypothetical protein [Cyanobacteria bacterium UBA11166]HBR73783.1 hypothetical protein [Cyanobacteria bacterium UBA11159]HBS70565.1 hypothetical protein [Cyanobacteria bacterium UBA11153]HBW88378.1 hypothetical protein [Cyanobacteria bacterium UBA11149]
MWLSDIEATILICSRSKTVYCQQGFLSQILSYSPFPIFTINLDASGAYLSVDSLMRMVTYKLKIEI